MPEILALLGERDVHATDPERLFHIARYNKMLHLVPMDAHASLAPRLLDARIRTARMNALAQRTGAEMSAVLAKKDVAHVVMKGPWQQVAVHGTAPMRPSGDVDLFVARQDRHAASAVLQSLGFTVFEQDRTIWWVRFLGEQHFHRKTDGAVADLHHRLMPAGLPSWRRADEVLARAVLQDAVPVPDPATGCLLLATTIAKALLANEAVGWAVRDLWLWQARLSAAEQDDLLAVARRAGQMRALLLAQQLVQACHGTAGGTGEPVLRGIGRENLRSLVYQPWHVPHIAPRRRHLLWALGQGRPIATAWQTAMAAVSPVVLSVLSRRS